MTQNRFRSRRPRSRPKRQFNWGGRLSKVWERCRTPLLYSMVLSGITGLLFGAWMAVQKSPYFMVREVSIRSISHLDDQNVMKTVGLTENTNLFSFDEIAAQRALLEHPWVAEAVVKKDLPGRVSIELTERKAKAILVLNGLFFVDATGHPFVEVTMDEIGDFPLVTGLTRDDFDADEEAAKGQIRSALGVVDLYRSHAIAKSWPLGSVDIALGGRINLMLGETRIGLGSDKFGIKLDHLKKIHAALTQRKIGAEYILFGDDPSRVIVKEKMIVDGSDESLSLNTQRAHN